MNLLSGLLAQSLGSCVVAFLYGHNLLGQAHGLDYIKGAHAGLIVEAFFKFLVAVRGENQNVGPENLVGCQRVACGGANALDVACGQGDVVVNLTSDQHDALELGSGRFTRIDAQRIEGLGQLFGGRLVEFQAVEDDDLAVLDALGERLAHSEVANLLVEFLDVNAGLGAVRHAAATPDGVALVTDAGAAGAFLAPRFCAGAGDLGDRLGAGVAGALRGVVGDDRPRGRLGCPCRHPRV